MTPAERAGRTAERRHDGPGGIEVERQMRTEIGHPLVDGTQCQCGTRDHAAPRPSLRGPSSRGACSWAHLKTVASFRQIDWYATCGLLPQVAGRGSGTRRSGTRRDWSTVTVAEVRACKVVAAWSVFAKSRASRDDVEHLLAGGSLTHDGVRFSVDDEA